MRCNFLKNCIPGRTPVGQVIYAQNFEMEPTTRPKKTKSQSRTARKAERSELLAGAETIEEIIRQHAEDTIRAVEHQIMTKDSEGLTEVNHPLPSDFSRDGGIEAGSMQAVVWGKTIEYFEERPEEFDMAVVRAENDNSFLLRLRWKKSIDPELVRHYRDKVGQYVRNS